MNSFFLVISCVLIVQSQITLQTPVQKKVCDTQECALAAKNLKDSIDTKHDPCDDFYQFACGKWPETHPNENQYMPNSSILIRSDNNNKEIREFLERKNSADEPEAVHKTRKLYATCVNEDTVFKNGIQPLRNILSAAGLPEEPPFDQDPSFDLPFTLATLYKLTGNGIFFNLAPMSDPYDQTHNVLAMDKPSSGELAPLPLLASKVSASMSESDYMCQIMIKMCENKTTEICKNLKQTESKYFSVARSAFSNYETEASQLSIKEYPKKGNESLVTALTLKELQELTDNTANDINSVIPTFNWTQYLSTLYKDVKSVSLDYSKPENIRIVVEAMDYMKDVILFLHKNSLHQHEFYIWYFTVKKLGVYTDYTIASTTQSYTDILGNKTREETCTELISQVLGMAVSYYYATTPLYAQTKTEISDMVVHIKHSLKDTLQSATWMDDKTKKTAIEKVDAIKSLVAYPSSIKTASDLDEYYKGLEITDNFLETLLAKIQRDVIKDLNSLNTINDINRDRRILTPTIVNAFYDPERNSIIIPAGILGTPLYGPNSIKALVYGSVGSIVGHEITHGFDNSGSRFNALGNMENWWESQTLDKYKEKARCFLNAYKNYTEYFAYVKMQGDSEITIGEDIADNGGFKEALYAYRHFVEQNGEEPVLPSFEQYTHEQLLTLSFANLWCENPTILSAFAAKYSDHSPNGVRVNGVAKNSEEFAKIWNCPKGSKMNPDDKCVMW